MLFIIITALYFIITFSFLIGLFFPNRKTTPQKFKVSVVVAARNEENNIESLLNDMINQTYSTELYEIIIVNDGSEDNTGTIIDRYVEKYNLIKHIRAKLNDNQGLTGKKNALNQGIQRSNGEIILTTDADCRVKKTWIESMVSYFTKDVGMVVGFSQFANGEEQCSILEQLQAIDFLSLMAATQGAININCPLAASGQNLAYRKSVFEQVNGFQKIKHRVSGDDVLLLQLINKFTEWRIRFASSAKSFNYTHAEKTLKSFLNLLYLDSRSLSCT